MPRIAGVDVPADKTTWCALTFIHGVGRTAAFHVASAAPVDRGDHHPDTSSLCAHTIRPAASSMRTVASRAARFRLSVGIGSEMLT